MTKENGPKKGSKVVKLKVRLERLKAVVKRLAGSGSSTAVPNFVAASEGSSNRDFPDASYKE